MTDSSFLEWCKKILWGRVVMERNSTRIFFYYTVSGTHWKAMMEIFIRKEVLTNQRSERCFSHMKKKNNNNKNDTSNQKPQRCVSFAPKFLPFIGACSLQRPRFPSCFAGIQRVKAIKWSRQINNEREKTERDVSLYSVLYLFVLFIGAKFICFCLYSKQSFYLKSHF